MAKKPRTNANRQKETEWSKVSLIIAGKHLDPEKVFGALNVIPDDWFILGEPFGKNRKCKQGCWSIEGRPSHGRIETQMKNILKRISQDKHQLKKIIKQEKTIRDAYLKIAFEPRDGIPNACYCFDAELINEFTSLGIDIALSIHIKSEWDKFFAEVEREEKQKKTGR